MTTRIIPVGGTWSWNGRLRGEWWQQGSPLLRALAEHGIEPVDADDPFAWSTRVGGLPWDDRHMDWRAGGLHLLHYAAAKLHDRCNGATTGPTIVVAHSHGGQVAAYAAAAYHGLQIDVLVTLMTPVRDDMADVWDAARPRIGHWLHVHTAGDRMQRWGSWFDGVFDPWRPPRKMPLADINVGVPRVGHSGLVTNPEHFPLWADLGLIDTLRYGGHPPTRAQEAS